MLFWTKFLSITQGVAQSVHVFLPLYFFHLLHFSYYQIGVLLATYLTTRMVASGFWTAWVDQHTTQLHGVLTSLLTALGAASLVLALSIPPDTWIAIPAAILCMMLDGWFFQPLGVLVDSIIVKILGDYKLLYESERRWGKLSLGLTAIGIGCFLDDDHDFDTLMGTMLIGCMGLFLLALSTTVQPADPALLGLKMEDSLMETSPLLPKSWYYDDDASHADEWLLSYARAPCSATSSSSSLPSTMAATPTAALDTSRKPQKKKKRRKGRIRVPDDAFVCSMDMPTRYYYGDQLSHISEEDASMIQRMASTIHAPSIMSNNNTSLEHLLDNSTFQFTQQNAPSSAYCFPQPCTTAQLPPQQTPHASLCSSSTSTSSLPNSPPPWLASFPNQQQQTRFALHTSSLPPPMLYNDTNSSLTSSPTTSHTSSLLDLTFMSMTLALLPLPPPDVPMVVLITWFPRFQPSGFASSASDWQQQSSSQQATHGTDGKQTRQCALMLLSSFFFGLVASMQLWSPLIYYDYFLLPMHTIGILVFLACVADVIVTTALPIFLDRYPLPWLLVATQLLLIANLLAYAWLPVGDDWCAALCLGACHTFTFGNVQLIWLMTSYQIDRLYLANCQDRMMLRGKVSALFSSLGPALGSLLLGRLFVLGWSFPSIYISSAILALMGTLCSFGWTMN
ncbi:hypothetical protein BC940DRAFT_343392 [Gongronella butleri]|nr:hypothetical protein BC940DRAFT_343392 [Gongronella butleri]